LKSKKKVKEENEGIWESKFTSRSVYGGFEEGLENI
jgi:hypothetical protein